MIISWTENNKNIIICNAFLKYIMVPVKPSYLPKSKTDLIKGILG